jgi:hypothetical protein
MVLIGRILHNGGVQGEEEAEEKFIRKTELLGRG